ncbi:hypothetical protein NPIL_26541 [Nephila pilipes]|uniref:Uncharacterized protein n=1 Tax=Nephila pilipes TaxID=299642 RepID=A0A8X6QF58_NEPPI|nr:hypothetical protein NPIL_26541 [Nephila pilipes]
MLTSLYVICVRSRNEGKRSSEKNYLYIWGCSETKHACHRWFKKFKNRNLKDATLKGRPQKLDDDVLKVMVDSDLHQTIEESSLKIDWP